MRTEARKKYLREWKRKWRLDPTNLELSRERNRRCMNKHRQRYRAAARAKRLADPEKFKAKAKAFYRRHRERIRAAYKANPEKSRASHRAWVAKHPDKARAASVNCYPKVAAWLKLHPEKAAEYQNRRRAKKKATETEDCAPHIRFLRLMPLCQYCFTLIEGTPHADHVIPLNRDGPNHPRNLVACCKPCNSSKRDKLLSEWSGRRELKEAE